MTGSSFLTFGMLIAFIALIIAVLYATKHISRNFTDYAVGGRSFSSWFLAMSYTNSWWPGATYTAFFGLSAGAGVLGLYALAYSLLGVTAMYLMAERAWLWGKRFDLRTQCDMLGLRFDSPAVRVVASLIGVTCQFPWLVLGIQAMAVLFQFASFGKWSPVANLTAEAHTRGCSVEDLLGSGALDALDEPDISRALYTGHMPDPDLVIRTSGEQRISNFLLWQIAYSEIFVTDRLWPDFRGIHLLEAIADYQRRERRFGGLGESTDEAVATLQPAEEVAAEIQDHLVPKSKPRHETKSEPKSDHVLSRR